MSGSAFSTRVMSASSNICGPKLGTLPVVKAAVLTTADTWASMSFWASARLTSGWSMTAMSPSCRRPVPLFPVQSRVWPWMPGVSVREKIMRTIVTGVTGWTR